MTRWSWIMMCIVLAGFLQFLRIGISQSAKFSPVVREAHNVEVMSKVADRVYNVKFVDLASPMTIRLCAYGDDLPLRAGMVIEPFQYIQEPDCLLINEHTYVDYLRNKKFDVVDKSGQILFAKE